jgi:CRISPR type I-E-associated protein CasB/Cse2
MQTNDKANRYVRNPERRLAARLAALAEERNDPYHMARKRQTLAALRRGLATNDGWHPAVAQVVDSLFVSGTVRPSDQPALYQGAALFSSHPFSVLPRPDHEKKPPSSQSLGRALHNLVVIRASSRGRDVTAEKDTFDPQFQSLLNAHPDDLFAHLRRTIARFQGTEVGIDWAKLMSDIRAWDDSRYRVQRQWARDWWSAEPDTLSWAEQNTSTDPENSDHVNAEAGEIE